MNRAQRRASDKRRRAISKELVRMEKPEQYHQGYMDGGRDMTEAVYASFCLAMTEQGYGPDDILAVLQALDEKIFLCAGNHELIQEAFDASGIQVDFSQVFAMDRIQKKE